MSYITKVLDANKAKAPKLVDLLNERLSHYEAGRSYAKIHASMLTSEDKKFCPREAALCDLLDIKPKDRFIPAALRATFDVGWATHHLVTDKWLTDIAIGEWRCVRCHTVHAFGQRPYRCKSCQTKVLEYVEPVFTSKTYGYTGSIDVLLDLGQPKLVPCEIKSMDKDQFATLAAPLAEHRLRSVLYLQLIRDANEPIAQHIDGDEFRILYVSKGYGKKTKEAGTITPFKEYTVDRKGGLIDKYLSLAKSVKRYHDEGVMPEGICPNSFHKRVKKCSCPKECWAGKYIAGVKVK